jgi:hypothetical protein
MHAISVAISAFLCLGASLCRQLRTRDEQAVQLAILHGWLRDNAEDRASPYLFEV